MVRATEKAKSILKRCAAREHRAQTIVLEEALEAYERGKLLEDVKRGFQELRSDPKVWSGYKREAQVWDTALGDGLPHEDSQ